jgi:6-pyruvoyltetrahydropterin/6-carboxytetrahydropterin synthase
MIIGRHYEFESAHFLPGHPKCGKTHGHSYKLAIEISGPVDARGVVIDFHELDVLVKPIIDRLDHCMINDQLSGNPTAEIIVSWIAAKLGPMLPNHLSMYTLTLYETSKNYVRWNRVKE